mgnify:CR=1 FL=1
MRRMAEVTDVRAVTAASDRLDEYLRRTYRPVADTGAYALHERVPR